MFAMQLTGSRTGPEGPWLDPVQLPDPEPGPGELLLDVSACAVCRTDLQIVSGDLPQRRSPLVPGHQIVGRIAGRGTGVSEREHPDGQRVGVAWTGGCCGVCRFCATGRENLCSALFFTGWDRDGGYATAVTVRADFAHPLPDGFDDLAAAPLLCGGVIGYRSLGVAGVDLASAAGTRLGLYGFGASATIVIQLAVSAGVEVFVATRSAAEQEAALALGAAWAGSYDQSPGTPLDFAITFAPSGDVVVAALRAVDRGGTVAVNAIHLDRIPEFDYDLLWGERSLRSVANVTRRDAREFLARAATIPIRTRTDVFALREANTALARLQQGRIRGAAVLSVR